MRRHALGILAILLLIVAVYGWITYGLKDSEANLFFSTCERIGLVFGVTWLAYPQLVRVASKTSARFVLLMVGIGLIILVRPKSIFMLGPVMLILAGLQFAGWLMRPARPKAAGGSPGARRRMAIGQARRRRLTTWTYRTYRSYESYAPRTCSNRDSLHPFEFGRQQHGLISGPLSGSNPERSYEEYESWKSGPLVYSPALMRDWV